jgi:hypothetical protein
MDAYDSATWLTEDEALAQLCISRTILDKWRRAHTLITHTDDDGLEWVLLESIMHPPTAVVFIE